MLRNPYKKSRNTEVDHGQDKNISERIPAKVTPSSAASPTEKCLTDANDTEAPLKKGLGDAFDDEAFLHLMKLPDGDSEKQNDRSTLAKNKNRIRLHAEYLKGSLVVISSTIQGGTEGGFLMQAVTAMEDQEFNHIFKKYDIRCSGRVPMKNNLYEPSLNEKDFPYHVFIIPMVNPKLELNTKKGLRKCLDAFVDFLQAHSYENHHLISLPNFCKYSVNEKMDQTPTIRRTLGDVMVRSDAVTAMTRIFQGIRVTATMVETYFSPPYPYQNFDCQGRYD
jgi:hypothetical protein